MKSQWSRVKKDVGRSVVKGCKVDSGVARVNRVNSIRLPKTKIKERLKSRSEVVDCRSDGRLRGDPKYGNRRERRVKSLPHITNSHVRDPP